MNDKALAYTLVQGIHGHQHVLVRAMRLGPACSAFVEATQAQFAET